ncbi:bifunctional DNA primase/polymerase [Bradyrhizobium sp. CCBAU 51627]|uniref:bifunctional DNA primase/polymerase n=1 Tax=Bradyrhizobium sp. CCBAU 51627 TaxID=1325088 RepID=UPI0023067402|nr:bifunctional DNA primase/polymerase [Bradyrhizobium sp. CCBAU 51627]
MPNSYHEKVADATKFFDFAEPLGLALVKVHPGAKNPVGEGWQNLWSRDRVDWEQWVSEGFNIGVHAGASGLVIIDLDVKHGGLDAVRLRVDTWCRNNGIDALSHHVTTPSGGQHIYLRVPPGVDAMTLAGNTAGALGKGVDILAGNKQALAPGSAVGNGKYVFQDATVYAVPEFVLDFCKRAPVEAPVAKVGTFDRGDVATLVNWLNERDGFDSYDDWCQLGMALRAEFGDDGKLLWALSHNDTVTPDVIETKWRSFATDAKPGAVTLATFMRRAHDLGWTGKVRQSVASMFGGVAQLATLPAIASPPLAPGVPLPSIDQDDDLPTPELCFPENFGDDFRPPSYLIDGILQRRFCYSMTAQTGTGKTAIGLLFAAHVATGEALGARRVKRGWVLYFAGENPDDVKARWFGLCGEMRIDPKKTNVIFVYGVTPLSKTAERIARKLAERGVSLSFVVVDTAAAYFEGDNDNDNVQAGNHARTLRSLVNLPGEPCVMVLCHPTKNAKEIGDMVPRGGGAFLNEVDGNLGAARVSTTIAMQTVGKFRGPELSPIHFGLHVVRDHPRLVDEDGRPMPTVVAHIVSEAGAAAQAAESETAEIQMLRDIGDHPGDATRKRAARLGCHHDTVASRIKRLVSRKMVDDSGFKLKLTSKGEKELNALDRDKSLSEGSDNAFPFPVPGRK